MSPAPKDPKEIRKVRRLALKGLRRYEIAEKIGRSRSYVSRLVERHAIKVIGPVAVNESRLVELAASGVCRADIARTLKVAPCRVDQAADRLGVTLPRGHRGRAYRRFIVHLDDGTVADWMLSRIGDRLTRRDGTVVVVGPDTFEDIGNRTYFGPAACFRMGTYFDQMVAAFGVPEDAEPPHPRCAPF